MMSSRTLAIIEVVLALVLLAGIIFCEVTGFPGRLR